ncbi:tetraacyldisaccharide 4'-kinase [Afifella pfennigii]|uniref:tetraacyldisaccharide 4'-kinase n=1 Tax=Afifella pfennigii TaxID=209897 RepID=UPI00047B83BE|nr:tetraacyldisaccharide 4'-kinase [Afifella pfennigii]
MRAPSFWWRKGAWQAAALSPFGFAYGLVAGARMRRAGAAAPKPVLCIGNFVLGGAGKTPLCLAIGALAQRHGLRPGFLTRGYGGAEAGPLRVDLRKHSAEEVGDEPLLLAERAVTVVARDRVAGARALAEAGVDLIVMDDGFQNPSLNKDVSLIVVDGARGLGNGGVFPAGPLRAPLAAQLDLADAVLVMGEGEPGEAAAGRARAAGLPVFSAALRPSGAADWAGAPLLAFAGIAAPQRFFASLQAAGASIGERRAFADHHPYSEADAQALLELAEARGLVPVTTEKDAVRLRGAHGARAALYARAKVFGVEARLAEETALWAWLTERLALVAPAGGDA